MKEKFLDALTYGLVDSYNFIPLIDDEGKMLVNSPVRILEASANAGLTLIELIDGDMFDSDFIGERLRENSGRLSSINSREAIYWFEVFVFQDAPDPEKLRVISGGQFQAARDQRFLSCVTVDLSDKNVERHYEKLKMDGFIDKAVDEAFQSLEESGKDNYDIPALVESKKKEYTIEFRAKTPVLTYALIATNIAVWLFIHAVALAKGIDYSSLLMSFGAKENLQIMTGQYWRLLTPVFLHANIVHLGINCYSLYMLGVLVERIYGNAKFFFVYFAAGIIGNIASFMFSPNAGVGASGAIFGLMGALLYFGIENPKQFRRYFGSSIIITLVINISYGLSPNAGIDNFAHMGGLIGGFLASGIVQLRGAVSKFLKRPVFITATVLVLAASLYYGFTCNQNVIAVKVDNMEKLSEAQNWGEAEKLGLQILDKNPKDKVVRIKTLWVLVVAEASQDRYDKAFVYADSMKQVDEARGSYLKGALYFDTRQYSLAKQELQRAKELDAGLGDVVDKLLAELAKISQ